MEGLKGILAKPWFWILVAGVGLYALLGRRKKPAAAQQGGTETDLVRAGGGIAARQEEEKSAVDKAMEALQLREISGQEQVLRYQQQRSEAEQSLYDRIFNRLATGKGPRIPKHVKCPSGNIRLDPTTLQVYCREKQHQGFFQGIQFRDVLGAYQAYGTTRGPRTSRPRRMLET